MKSFLARLGRLSPAAWALIGAALIVLVGAADYRAGPQFGLSVFYLSPVALMGWYGGRRLGYAAAVLASLSWLITNLAAGLHFSSPAFYVWNTLTWLGRSLVVGYLFSELRRTLQHERQLARTDFLTGALNSRAFYELLELEIARLNRYGRAFTLVYLDIDDFKGINDQLGHGTGDEVLRGVVQSARAILRASDQVARLGGDEFAILLPETPQHAARAVLERVRHSALEMVRRRQWPVTFSMGALTCQGPLNNADQLVRAADELMYAVKHKGKDQVLYASHPAPEAPAAGN